MRMTFGRGFLGLFLASQLTMIGCSQAPDQPESSAAELGARAIDATGMGPLATTSAEYRFDAKVDADVLGDRMTEVWAQVYRPETLAPNEKHPVLVFLHGNHGTCGRGS